MEMTEEDIWGALLEKTKSDKIEWKQSERGNGRGGDRRGGDPPDRDHTNFSTMLEDCEIRLIKLNEVQRKGFELFVRCRDKDNYTLSAEDDSPQHEAAEELYNMLEKAINDVVEASEITVKNKVLSRLGSLLSRNGT